MTLKFEHDVKIRADLGKIRAKFEQNSSKKEAALTEDWAFSPISTQYWKWPRSSVFLYKSKTGIRKLMALWYQNDTKKDTTKLK